MLHPVRWPFWVVMAGGGVTWLLLGFNLPQQPANLNDILDVAMLCALGATLLFILIYTIAGLTGPAKWWRNDVGTYLVLAITANLGLVVPVAFAVLFNHGHIDTWWWGWVWAGGFFLSATTLLFLSWLWLRNLPGRNSEKDDSA
jgi:hypothetical protein